MLLVWLWALGTIAALRWRISRQCSVLSHRRVLMIWLWLCLVTIYDSTVDENCYKSVTKLWIEKQRSYLEHVFGFQNWLGRVGIFIQQKSHILASFQFDQKVFVPLWIHAAGQRFCRPLPEVVAVRIDFDTTKQIRRLIEARHTKNGQMQITHQ